MSALISVAHQNHQTILSPFVALLVVLLVVWSLGWKCWALWRAGRDDDLRWFIILFFVNTFGLLEIWYIYARSNSRRQFHFVKPESATAVTETLDKTSTSAVAPKPKHKSRSKKH